ncbi:formate dehydrogenase accessory sulfurtransferase FdhD [Salipiger sp. IMCC34102]|uniref:formate dehydrogenase accessory sulfurtransferase FdhD n=1 Tax=Salipiger sp. IMCC34102 TaxID=2510647 RepID=UPI00101D51A4|nr:formate dehydrogenase accessory sulfurtransferase FdhD [Salipiger sp. IMCC34102]RYH04462.1 formate dehydrogenase accessory sulfurtransferase FdhD [Salipiger sp. IMCC34102]
MDKLERQVEPLDRERHRFDEGGGGPDVVRDVAVEAPVAIEVDGFGLAVMMATPSDLEDFATGFAVAEGLLNPHRRPRFVEVAHVPDGLIVRMGLGAEARAAVQGRVRARVSESACGLCGLESLQALAAALPRIAHPVRPGDAAVARALAEIGAFQPLARATGAAHAAALCAPDGRILLAREDVGRHNAFDKMVGGAMRADLALEGHFALVTSRLSFELVEKAARAGIGGVVAISAPTSMALRRAEEAGLPVVVRARQDGMRRPQTGASLANRPDLQALAAE